jgi:hypothetical protein
MTFDGMLRLNKRTWKIAVNARGCNEAKSIHGVMK